MEFTDWSKVNYNFSSFGKIYNKSYVDVDIQNAPMSGLMKI